MCRDRCGIGAYLDSDRLRRRIRRAASQDLKGVRLFSKGYARNYGGTHEPNLNSNLRLERGDRNDAAALPENLSILPAIF
jgi:hypothetical protein